MHETGPRLLARKCNEYVRERVGIFEWALLNEVVRKSVPMLVSDGWSVGWVCRHELTLFMWHLSLWRFWLDSKALQSHDITHKRSPKNTEKKFNRKSTWDGGAERRAGKEKKVVKFLSWWLSFIQLFACLQPSYFPFHPLRSRTQFWNWNQLVKGPNFFHSDCFWC